MSQIKVNSRVVVVPSKFFPNDPVISGKIIRKFREQRATKCQILWDSGKSNVYSEFELKSSPQIHVFSDQKKALAFMLSI